jgi:hypothetical protein
MALKQFVPTFTQFLKENAGVTEDMSSQETVFISLYNLVDDYGRSSGMISEIAINGTSFLSIEDALSAFAKAKSGSGKVVVEVILSNTDDEEADNWKKLDLTYTFTDENTVVNVIGIKSDSMNPRNSGKVMINPASVIRDTTRAFEDFIHSQEGF